MEEFLGLFNQYARSELMILVPVLLGIAQLIHKSNINSNKVSGIVTVVSVSLCGIYTLATVQLINMQQVFLALFTAITQGVLFAWAAIFGGILLKPDVLLEYIKKMASTSNTEQTTVDKK